MGDRLVAKKCWKCGEYKPLGEFHRCSERRDGHQTHCKDCAKARDYSIYGRTRRLRRHGLTKEAYQAIMERQEGCCPGCGRKFNDEEPHIDHCHRGGGVRGVLCRRCNLALGLVDDDPAILRALADYLNYQPHPLGSGR